MTPRDVLALTALVVGTLLAGSVLVTASQGRGLDADTTAAIGAQVAAIIAGSLGFVVGKKRKADPPDSEQ